MKSVIVGTILAIVLFGAAAAAWSEARLTRSVAEAHRRLATLHYDPEDDIDTSGVWSRVPWPMGAAEDVTTHRATVSYWLSRYDPLIDMARVTGPQAVTDPTLLLVAANASFRSSAPELGDRKLAVDRLDGVMQAYAEVLRKDGHASDAAYNYEFVAKLRDSLAKASRTTRNAPKRPALPEIASVDLPSGLTVHGRPGGPPPGTDMSDFKTITPMRYDEREEQLDPGRGKVFKRKG